MSSPEELLSDRTYREVYAYLYSRVGCAEDAEDIAQETFLRATKALRGGHEPDHFKAWLFKIAKNEVVMWAKRTKRERRLQGAALSQWSEAVSDNTQARLEIEETLKLLDEKSREAVVFVHMLGYSYREAAEVLGVPISTMMSRVYHGRSRLRQILGAKLDRGTDR